jgi:hypothetical protein
MYKYKNLKSKLKTQSKKKIPTPKVKIGILYLVFSWEG